jgi:tetratricopeptide (TPR) repeat protein
VRLRTAILLALGFIWVPAHAAEDRLATAIAQFEAMHTDEALRSFVKLQEKNPKDAQVFYYLGRLQQRKFHYEQAAKWLRQAVELDPSKADYRVSLCEVLGDLVDQSSILDQISMAREVNKNLTEAVEREPTSTRARDALMHYYLEAPTIAGGSSRKALDQAAAIAKIDRGLGHLALGDIALVEKRLEDATREYTLALQARPNNPDPLFQLVITYQQRELYPSAQTVLNEIKSRFPAQTAVNYYQAENLILSGEISHRVVTLLETYIKQGPSDDDDPTLTQAYMELGHLQELLNQKYFARQAYKAARDLNPNLREARRALRELD